MIRTSGVAGSWTDTAVSFFQERFAGKLFIGSIGPEFLSDNFMEAFRKSFGKPVCKRFQHNIVVIIVVFYKLFRPLFNSNACCKCKGPYIVLYSGSFGCDKV